jgi:hypothetical protein
MMALNAGESSAKLFNCSADGQRCSGGQGGPGGGGGGSASCTGDTRDTCTVSGGSSNFMGQGPAGGRINQGETTEDTVLPPEGDCVLSGNIPNPPPPCPEDTTS